MANVCILGGGGWGIGLANVLNDNLHNVTIWSIVPDEVEMLDKQRENTRSLPGIKIDEKIKITGNLEEAINDKDIIVMATASSYVRSTSHLLKELVPDGQIIVDVAKGIEDKTLFTMTDIIEDEVPNSDAVVLSGPSHAEEVARRVPTSVVVGAHSKETAEFVQSVFSNDYFRVYTSPDMLGIEIGGALKNVIALAAGIADGIGCGDNTKAALITRGIVEISRLGEAMGGQPDTFSGLSGIGDLIVTCASMHSRNRRAGILIGEGMTMEEAMKEVNMVVEGVYSAKAALGLSIKYEVPLPIIEEVNKVLFENKPAKTALIDLMNRDLKGELKNKSWNN